MPWTPHGIKATSVCGGCGEHRHVFAYISGEIGRIAPPQGLASAPRLIRTSSPPARLPPGLQGLPGLLMLQDDIGIGELVKLGDHCFLFA